MTIKDEILAELRNGTTFAEIQRKFRSKSQTYEALREYFAEVDRIVEEKRDREAKAQLALTEVEAELDNLMSEKGDVSAEVQELSEDKANLSEEVRSKTETLAALNADIEELQSRGFTPEILSELTAIRDRSGPELLRQVKTVEKYQQAKKEISRLKTKQARLKRENSKLETQQTRLKEQLISERNKLDEMVIRVVTFRDAVDIAESLLSDGYSSDDIESLKHGLDMLGIKGDPTLSVTRLVKWLSKQKSLAALDENIAASRAELASLQKELAVTEGKINAMKQVALKAVEESKDSAVAAIAGVAADVDTAIGDTAVRLEEALARSLSAVDAYVRQMMAGVNSELREWGEIQRQKGELEKLLLPGGALVGILESPEALEKVDLPLVVRLVERLHLWSERNLQNVSISPAQYIQWKEPSLMPFYSYNVSALIEFIHYGLKQKMIQRERSGER